MALILSQKRILAKARIDFAEFYQRASMHDARKLDGVVITRRLLGLVAMIRCIDYPSKAVASDARHLERSAATTYSAVCEPLFTCDTFRSLDTLEQRRMQFLLREPDLERLS